METEAVEILRARTLRAVHGFPTRAGGVSAGAFASLNAGGAVGDDAAAVEENRRRLERSAGLTGRILRLRQVHGSHVLQRRGGELPEADASEEADGHWTGEAALALGVLTADCLPVLLEDPVQRRVAAVHAGWRGVIGGVLRVAVEALVSAGSAAGDLQAAIGPSIGPCCFEVQPELAERFTLAYGAGLLAARSPSGGPAGGPSAGPSGAPSVGLHARASPRVDLWAAARAELERAGVPPAAVEVLGLCTVCDARFFSHRRDAGRTGRQLSFIACTFSRPAGG